MLTITKSILSESLWGLKCTFAMSPEKICIHNTANDASAYNEARYVANNPDAKSYHYAVDDIQAIQILPLDRNGWHAGDGSYGAGNRKSIGIEICYSESGGERFEKAQENAAELCAILMRDLGWGLDLGRITKHEDYSGKHCPHRTLDYYGWDYFLNLVKEKYEITEGDLPMTNEEKKAFDELVERVNKAENENAELKKSLENLKASVAPCITSVNWDAHITGAMGGKEAVAMLNDLKAHGDFHGKDEGHYGLSEQMVRLMLIFYRMLKRLGIYK